MGKKIEVVDCTSEKHTSKHFKKSLETYKLLFESSGIPIFVFDINGTIILYNQAAIKIIGGTAKEYIGKSLIGIFGDNFGLEYIKRVLLTAESDVSLEYEDFVQLPTGNHWFLSNFTRIQNSDGLIIGVQVIWYNFTEHKQRGETIRKNEEKLHALFSALTDVIIEIDSDGLLIEVLSLNPSLHSESYGELVGKTLHEIFPKTQADFIHSNVKRTLEVGEPMDINHSLHISEKELIFEGKLSPLKSNSVLLVEREVTERKKAEEAVRSANLYNRSLIEASLDPFVTVGQDGKITDVNRATELVTGFSHKQLIGDDFSNYFTDSKKAMEGYQKVLVEGFVRDYPLTIKHVSGKTIDVLYNATVYKNEKDEIQGVFAAARDITEQKLAEETLKKDEERFQTSTENMLDPFGIYTAIRDLSGKIVDFQIEYVNAAACKSNQMTKEEQIGKSLCELSPVHRNTGLFNEYCHVVETGKPLRKDTLIYQDAYHGKRLVQAFDISVVRLGDGFAATWRDITVKKKAQEEIHNSKKQLEQLYKHLNDIRENERAEISREIHDELGQSLTALSMDLNWIKENAADRLLVEKKISGMLGIVKDTLKRVQKISATLRPGMLDDLGLVPAIEWYCHEFEERTGIRCNLILENIQILDQKLTLTLFRVLQEGLTNIIRHANAKNVEITLCTSVSKIFLKITDNGVGASMEKLQSKDSLGLIGMKERLKQFSGTLEVISTINRGTTLEITIPQNGWE